MLGYPGAGKTTVAKIISHLSGAVHLWADHERREIFGTPTYSHEENLHLYNQLNDEASRLLAAGQSVIYDTNFNYYRDRELLRKIAATQHAQTVLVWLTIEKDLALQRATDSPHTQSTRVLGNMPVETFNHITDQFETPQANERTVVLDGTKIAPDYVAKMLGL